MELAIFEYTEEKIRFFESDGTFEVAAADIAKILEYSRTSDFVDLVDEKFN
jgi:prophage antirepressor-like protein